jgi:hypothetical protein
LYSLLHTRYLLSYVHATEDVLYAVELAEEVQTNERATLQMLLEKFIFNKVAIPKVEVQLVPQLKYTLLDLDGLQVAICFILVLNIVHFHTFRVLHSKVRLWLHSLPQF